MCLLINKLNERDAVSIVVYDQNATRLAPLMQCCHQGKQRLCELMRNLEVGNGTNLCAGLLRGIQEVTYGAANLCDSFPIRATLLLTDGHPTTGTTNTQDIIKAANDTLKEMPHQCSIATLGIGLGHDASFLEALAKRGKGAYMFANKQQQIGGAIGTWLGGLFTTTHQNVRLTLKHTEGLKCRALTRFPCVQQERNKIVIDVGDVCAEERRDILVNFSWMKSAMSGGKDSLVLADATITGTSVLDNATFTSEEQVLEVDITDKAAIPPVDDWNHVVARTYCRYIATEALQFAKENGEIGKLREAVGKLEEVNHRLLSTNLYKNWDAIVRSLVADISDCLLNMRSHDIYSKVGCKKIVSYSMAHDTQRDITLDGSSPYQTSTSATMRQDFST